MDITMEFARRDDCLDQMVPSDLRELLQEIAQLREALRDAVSLIDPLMETTDEPYTEWDAVAITFLDTAKALTAATCPQDGE